MPDKSFLRRVIDSKDTASSRRLVTLVIAAHFVLASFAILFLVFYMVVSLPKGKVDIILLKTLETILEYDFYIIISGFGIITSEGLLSILVKRAGRKDDPEVPPPPPPPTEYFPPPPPPPTPYS